MALTGSMRDFGISEILQLIGHQKKSGTLEVKDSSRRVLALFDQGDIVSVVHDPFVEAFDLGTMLVRSGLLSPDQLAASQKQSRETLEPLEQILLKSEAVSLSELKKMGTLSRLEVMFSLFLWRDGDYSFEAGPVNYPHQWTDPISSEQVLMDGYRIKDEWPLLERKVPSLKLRLSKSSGEFSPQDKLDADERKIYGLVDGERSVEDIIFLSRMGSFEALKVIADLLDQGRIELSDRVEEGPVKDFRATLLRVAAAAALAAGLLAVAFGAFESGSRMFVPESGPEPAVREHLIRMYEGDRVRSALVFYAARTGRFPDRLEQIAGQGMLSSRRLKSLSRDFDYQSLEEGRSFRLTAAGGGE